MEPSFIFSPIREAVLLVSTAEPDSVNFTVTTFIEGNQNRGNYVATYGSTTQLSFPADSVYVTDSSQRDRAILVQAEEGKTISVYGVSEEGFLALPCDGMTVNNFNRYEYVIFSTEVIFSVVYTSEEYKSEFLIIPCEENTKIDITPSQLVTVEADDFKTTQFGPTSPQSILSATWEDSNGNLLSAGTTLQISHLRDLTGTLIRSDKPIVVFSGHPFADFRDILGNFFGHLVEQIPPHTTWGCTFLLNPLAITSSYDQYRVATVHNNTEVTITCVEEGGSVETSQQTLRTLNRAQGENWIELLTTDTDQCIVPFHSKYCSLKASNPVIVAYYNGGSGYNSDCELVIDGSPFMSLIPPVTQYLNNYTVPVINDISSVVPTLYYIGISVYEPFFDPNLIMIDGVPVEPDRSAWQGIYCSDGEICGYSISKGIDVQSGDRTVYHETKNAALSVQNYVFYLPSFGFQVGMELQPLSGEFSLILKHHFSFSITTQQQCNCNINIALANV